MAEWTPELKEEVIAEYVKANPTPETSSEIIAEIVEAHKDSGLTINGVRMVLVKADVYVKIEEGKTPKKGNGTASKRINKADSINELVSLIKSQGIAVASP